MKIAVTATGPTLQATMDPRFGRCACFIIIETADMSFEAVENPNLSLGGGVGIQSAQLMADKGVKSVLTGNCGPNAQQTLSAAGIGLVVGCDGLVEEIVNRFIAGQLSPVEQANVASHFGMADDSATKQEGSQTMTGRGMGAGGGGGMGKGMGQGGCGGGRRTRSLVRDPDR